MGDEGFDVAGVAHDQGKPGDRASTAAEDIRGHLADRRLEHAANVVCQQFRLTVLVGVVYRASRKASWVVGHDRVDLGQHWSDRSKPRSAHGVADQDESRAGALHLVVQTSSGDIQRVTRR